MGAVDVPAILERLGVPAQAAVELTGLLPADALGLLLYGSYARGDQELASDVDLLVLAAGPAGTRRTKAVSASTYTRAQLASAAGTLFGMHLARDGVVIFDTDAQLQALLDDMGQPDPEVLCQRIRHLAAVLEDRSDEHLLGRVRVARYLLRTAVYVAALADGEPCFSVRELAERARDPALVTILSSNPGVAPAPSPTILSELTGRLRAVVGPLAGNDYGSLPNLVVSEWFEDHTRATLGALSLADEHPEFDYAALAKVLL